MNKRKQVEPAAEEFVPPQRENKIRTRKKLYLGELLLGEIDVIFWVMTVLFFVFAIGAAIMYFGNFPLPQYHAELVRYLSPAAAICACFYLMFLGHKNEPPHIAMTIVYTVVYVVCCSLILWFAYNFHLQFPTEKESANLGRDVYLYLCSSTSFLLWLIYIFMAAAGLVFHLGKYIIDIGVFESDIFSIFVLIILPILSVILIGAVIVCIYKLARGTLELAANSGGGGYSSSSSSSETTYTVYDGGYERELKHEAYETYGSRDRYSDDLGHTWYSNDGGDTFYQE